MKILKISLNRLLKNKWLLTGILIILAISYLYLSKIFSIHFVDEEDNLILGHFLLGGQKLYSDLFSHHQPFAYILSAAIQFVTTPENIQQLIKHHRQFMVAYSLLWSGILLWRFREKIIIPLIIYESSKFYLLGNLFLSESLTVYPVLYLTAFLFEQKSKQNIFELLFIGFLTGLCAMLLAPLWPFLLAYLIFLFSFKKLNVKQSAYLLAGAFLPVLISLPFLDIYYYFYNVFYINFKYYIPQSGEAGFPLSLIFAFLSPVTVLFTRGDLASLSFILKIICIFFIGTLFYLIKIKNFRLVIAAITLLTLSNVRYFAPGLEYYSGFHVLIWYILFIFISFYFFAELILTTKKKVKVLLIIFMIVGTTGVVLSSKDLFKKNDMDHDYYVNYSEQYAYGEAIRAMRDEDDRLFVIEDEWLLYFQGDVKNSHKMVNLYGWMSLVWALHDPVIEHFKTNPPEFFYCECEEKTVLSYSDQYTQLIRDGAKTHLWVLNSKFSSLTDQQKDKLRFFHFQLD